MKSNINKNLLIKNGLLIVFVIFLLGLFIWLFVPSLFDVPEELSLIEEKTIQVLGDIDFELSTPITVKKHSKKLSNNVITGVTLFLYGTNNEGTLEVQWEMNNTDIEIIELKDLENEKILYSFH